MKLLDFLFSLFKKKKSSHVQQCLDYEIVEHDLDGKAVRQGIRILDEKFKGIVVTVSPSVKFKEVDDALHVVFDFTVEANPNHIDTTMTELRPVIGDIILDIASKDVVQSTS